MLDVRDLCVSYGHGDVLEHLTLEIPARSFTALLGANGAGKSTLLKTISGLMKARSGSIRFDGQDITGLGADRILRAGLALVPEGRKVFAPLTVGENLEMGAFTFLVKRQTARYQAQLDFVLDLFPKLKERLPQQAGTLSGGEQQMLAVGRALMSDPRMLLLDEPSMGLAPIVVEQIFETLSALSREGRTIFVCEQNIEVTLRHATFAHVLESGKITLSRSASELLDDDRVREAYLGV